MTTGYGHLFSPFPLGQLEARNRVVLAPMTVAYADLNGHVSDAEIEHYGRRAQGGTGLVVTEHFTVNLVGRQLPHQTVVDDRSQLPGLARLAREVHRHGALIVAQIGHAGRYAGPWDSYDREPRLAPSAVPFRLAGERVVTPQEITSAEIAHTITAFGNAAHILAEAGFDGVQIHASQGFLPSQFLSPRMNRRADAYGGDYLGRVKFLLEAVAEIRRRTDPGFLLGVQLLGDEVTDGGWSLAEAVRLAGDLEASGVDFLLPSVTTFETVSGLTSHGEYRRWGYQLGAAIAIRAAVSIPVIANGGITDPRLADDLIGHGLVDALGLARALLVDPDWPTKVAQGRLSEVRKCDCTPPTCLRTQLTGTICHSWPEAAQAAGFLGYASSEASESAPPADADITAAPASA
jgi:2,4-dienoyl-CoA reductase (NADPH2)